MGKIVSNWSNQMQSHPTFPSGYFHPPINLFPPPQAASFFDTPVSSVLSIKNANSLAHPLAHFLFLHFSSPIRTGFSSISQAIINRQHCFKLISRRRGAFWSLPRRKLLNFRAFRLSILKDGGRGVTSSTTISSSSSSSFLEGNFVGITALSIMGPAFRGWPREHFSTSSHSFIGGQ